MLSSVGIGYRSPNEQSIRPPNSPNASPWRCAAKSGTTHPSWRCLTSWRLVWSAHTPICRCQHVPCCIVFHRQPSLSGCYHVDTCRFSIVRWLILALTENFSVPAILLPLSLYCIVSTNRFVTECCKRSQNHGISFCVLYIQRTAISCLCFVCSLWCIFFCILYFFSASQDRFPNDLNCIGRFIVN